MAELIILEEIPEDTDEGNPYITKCAICGRTRKPTFRDEVGDFHGSPSYDFFCNSCGQELLDHGSAIMRQD